MLNRALFADVSLRPTFDSVQFHAWRGGLEERARRVCQTSGHSVRSKPIRQQSLRSLEYVYNNQQLRYYELLRVKSRSHGRDDFGLWSNTRDGEGTPRYRFCLGLLDVWLPADNYSWNCFSRRAWPGLRAIIDTEYARARVNMYMNMGEHGWRKRDRVYRADRYIYVYALYRFADRTDTLRWISSGF